MFLIPKEAMLSVSIIIPAYNEESVILKHLWHLQRLDGEKEIIVVDGGSADQTRMLARQFADKVIERQKGRSTQMNEGALIAKGEVLLFIHADTYLPKNALKMLSTLPDEIVGGGWKLSFQEQTFLLRILMFVNSIRIRMFKTFYGDHAIFVRRKVFWNVGGFALLPLMEDFDFAKRVKRFGRVIVLKESVRASARRFEKHGFFNVLWFMIKIRAVYFLGNSLKRLSLKYNNE